MDVSKRRSGPVNGYMYCALGAGGTAALNVLAYARNPHVERAHRYAWGACMSGFLSAVFFAKGIHGFLNEKGNRKSSVQVPIISIADQAEGAPAAEPLFPTSRFSENFSLEEIFGRQFGRDNVPEKSVVELQHEADEQLWSVFYRPTDNKDRNSKMPVICTGFIGRPKPVNMKTGQDIHMGYIFQFMYAIKYVEDIFNQLWNSGIFCSSYKTDTVIRKLVPVMCSEIEPKEKVAIITRSSSDITSILSHEQVDVLCVKLSDKCKNIPVNITSQDTCEYGVCALLFSGTACSAVFRKHLKTWYCCTNSDVEEVDNAVMENYLQNGFVTTNVNKYSNSRDIHPTWLLYKRSTVASERIHE